MKKLKAFAYIFYNSLTSTHYYKDILKTPFSFSIKYLLTLSIISTLITSAVTYNQVVPTIKQTLNEAKSTIESIYPQDLEITISQGQWSINQPEPYIIPTPQSLIDQEKAYLKAIGDEQEYQEIYTKNLIVFDRNGTINEFNQLDTLVLVNEKNVLIKNPNGFQANQLKLNEDRVINKQGVIEFLGIFDVINQYLPYIFIVASTLILFVYYFLYRLVYLLIVTLGLFVVNMFIKPSLDFKELYRIGLHSMTLPLILEVILLSGLVMLNIGIPWFFLLNVVIGSMVIYSSAKLDE